MARITSGVTPSGAINATSIVRYPSDASTTCMATV